MISIVVGLACMENLLDIFFLGRTQDTLNDVFAHLTILLFQSMFPIHAFSVACRVST
jgi:hypothetical protein